MSLRPGNCAQPDCETASGMDSDAPQRGQPVSPRANGAPHHGISRRVHRDRLWFFRARRIAAAGGARILRLDGAAAEAAACSIGVRCGRGRLTGEPHPTQKFSPSRNLCCHSSRRT